MGRNEKAQFFHDVHIKATVCHFFHTQSENIAMEEFLKPRWLSQLFPKLRAVAPDGAIHYLTERRKKKRKKEGLSGRREDIISNLYPLQHQPNYKVLIVQAAEEIACKIPHKMSVLVMLIMTVVSQSPTSLNMRVMDTKQQAPLSTDRTRRKRKREKIRNGIYFRRI